MIEEEFDLDIENEKKYGKNQAFRTKFDSSPMSTALDKEDATDRQFGEVAEGEMNNVRDGETGIVDYMAGFAKHVGVGVAKGVEETGQTLRLLDDNAWNLPEPKNIAESLGQGIGQFIPMFGVGGWALKGGLKLANLFQKSNKLSNAGRNLTAIGAGAFSDVMAFDPKDKNMGNLALSVGAISESPETAAFLKKYLAQQDEDSESVARMKNALTGMVAGAIGEGLIRGTGWAYRSVKNSKGKKEVGTKEQVKADEEAETNNYGDEDYGEQPIGQTRGYQHSPQDEFGSSPMSVKDIEEAVKDPAADAVEVFEAMRTSKGAAKDDVMASTKDLPDEAEAIVSHLRSEESNPNTAWENLKAEDSKLTDELLDVFHRMANGEEIDPQTFMLNKTFKGKTRKVPLIESMNFLKLDTEDSARNALQFFSNKLDIKKLAKPSVATQDLETVIPDLVGDFIDLDNPAAVSDAIEMVGRAASNVDEAIKFVGTSKILAKLTYDIIISASKRDAIEQTAKSQKAFASAVRNNELILRAGGLLSKKASDLLRSFSKQTKARDNQELLKAELLGKLQKSPKKLRGQISSSHVKLAEQDKITRKVYFEDLKQNKSTTVTKSETPTGKKATKKIKGFQRSLRTMNQRITARIKALKEQLASNKRPEKGQPFPKDRPIPETPLIKSLKADIKRVKQERDTLENKFKREAKDQLKYRKQHKALSEDIENLRKGIIPQKKGKELAPTEIAELKATKSKELQALKERMGSQQKIQKRIDKLNEKYTSLLLKRVDKDQDIGSRPVAETTAIEKELREAIKREEDTIKTRVTRKELEETLLSKSTRDIQDEVNKMSLRQLKTRVGALEKGFGAKTSDAFLELYVNGLLSSFKTAGVVNPVGNASAFVSTVMERAFAGATGNQIAMRESSELAWNFISGMPEAFKVFLSALKSGPKDGDVKLDFVRPHERAISKEAFNIGGNLGKVVDFMGTVVNIPGKILLAQDEAFKGLIVRGETRALAYRKARNKYSSQDISSPLIKSQIQKDFDDIMHNLSDHTDITEGARETAARNSFTNALSDKIVVDGRTGKEKVVPGLSKSVQSTIDKHGFLRLFVPFFRTPVNILNFTWERTPIIQFANKRLRDELTSSDPAVKQIAMARVGTSFAVTTAMFGMAMSGNFTGAPPRDRRLRKNMEIAMGGDHWYSFNFGGGWKKYDRFDPYGILMASSAAMATMGKSMINIKGQIDQEGDPTGALEEKYNEVINSTVVGTLELIKDRHYIQGISEFISFLSGDSRGLTPTFRRIAMAADPRISFYSSFRRSITRGIDPDRKRKLQRGVGETGEQNIMSKLVSELSLAHEEAMRDVTPGYGKVSPEKDLVGNTVSYPGTGGEFDTIHNLYNTAITPSAELKPSKSPLIQKLAELESSVEQPSSIKKMGNVTLNEEEKDFVIDTWTSLNKRIAEPLVKTKMFQNAPIGLQKLMLETLIKKNKAAAKNAALKKFERIKESYVENKIFDAKRKVTNQKTQGFQPDDNPLF